MRALIKIGGSLLDDSGTRSSIALQIAGLAASGVAVAVVHGGGKQMTRFLEERGIESRFVGGLRVTTAATIDAVLKVLAGSVNTELVGALAAAGARGVGLTGLDASLATAVQLDPDLGFVGRVTASDPGILNVLTGAGYLPVVACVAGGTDGQVYNVNGDSMAVAIASDWQVDRLVFLTDVAGVLDDSKSLVPELTVAGCRDLIAAGVAAGGMQAKLNAACYAVEHGVQAISIVRGSDRDVITQVFSGRNPGTIISK